MALGLTLLLSSTGLAAPTAYVIADGARLRAQPRDRGKSLERLAYGTAVEVLGPTQGDREGSLHCKPAQGPWVKVRAQGKTGWVWGPLLASDQPEDRSASVNAILAFRGPQEAAFGAWNPLIENLTKQCKAAGVDVVVVDPSSPCVTFGPAERPFASVDLSKSLQAQGEGFIRRKSTEASTYLGPERANWRRLFAYCNAEPPASPPLRGSARLLHFDRSAYGCAWHVYDLQTRRVRTLGRTETCPTEVTWAPDRKAVLYRTERGLFTDAWPLKGPTELPAPSLPEQTRVTDTWLDPASGRPRMLYVTPAQVRDQDGGKVFSAAGIEHFVSIQDGGAYFYLVEGKVRKTGADEERLFLPSWGLEQLAVISELRGDAWHTVHSAPTMCDAGETPCEQVLLGYGPPSDGLVRTADLQVRCNDGRTDCYAPPSMDQDPRLLRAVGLDPDSEDRDGLGFLPWTSGGVLFPVVFGDTPHAMGKVVVCSKDCKTLTPLPTGRPGNETLSIAPRGSFLMIADEVEQQNPHVFGWGDPKPMLRLEGRALWLPPSFVVE